MAYVPKSGTALAQMYLKGKLRGDRDANGCEVRVISVAPGRGLAMHNTGLPPVVEYDAFVSLQLAKTRGRQNIIDGKKLRRIALMRRDGNSLKECGVAVGVSFSCVHKWLNILPIHLGGAA